MNSIIDNQRDQEVFAKHVEFDFEKLENESRARKKLIDLEILLLRHGVYLDRPKRIDFKLDLREIQYDDVSIKNNWFSKLKKFLGL